MLIQPVRIQEPALSEPSILVIIFGRDPMLLGSVAFHLGEIDTAMEVHAISEINQLRHHLTEVRPDLVVVDGDTEPVSLLNSIADLALPARVPTLMLAAPEAASARQAMLERGVVGFVCKEGNFFDHIVDVLLESRRSAVFNGLVQETEQHYRDILEASSDGIFVLVGGRFRYANRSFGNALGRTPREIEGVLGLLDLVAEPARVRIAKEMARLEVSAGVREILDLPLQSHNGQIIAFEAACRSSIVEGRRAVVGVARDVTAERQLQDEVQRARARAAQVERLRALGELAAGVAHDFNNALGAILGRVGRMRKRLQEGLDVSADLDVLEKVARSASATAMRIQDFSKPSGTDTWQDVDLVEVAKDAAEFVQTRLSTGVRLDLEVHAVPKVRGNGLELHEVLLNLLNNAADATSSGGRLTVRVFPRDDRVVLEVQDTGTGMPQEVQQRIFEPFFSTKGDAGTGLGLSVSHWILRRHDADIQIHSEPGCGTTFSIAFPSRQAYTARVAKISENTLSVVVVDDDPAVAEMVQDILQDQGQRVTVVNNPQDAAKVLGQQTVDILITDLDLPGMSGWQLAKGVRDLQAGIIVGIITGWSVPTNEAELRSRGVDFVLPKPFTMEMLSAAVQRALASRGK